MISVIVCGGRDFSGDKFLYSILDRIHKQQHIATIIHGDARGADTFAGVWARKNNVLEYAEPADWDKYGKSAGYKRNAAMADLKPHMVIAFSGGRGTQMMVNIANERSIKVMDFRGLERFLEHDYEGT